MSILLKNGQIINHNSSKKKDIFIENNIIKEIGNTTITADKTINCEGLYISPGLVDMHCHLRDPGFLHKEDVETGVKSAISGGFTSIACMPNTNPPIDTVDTVKYIIDKAKSLNLANVYPIANITKGHAGQELTNVKALKEAGAIAISDDGKPVANSKLMREAIFAANENDIPIIEHCEDASMAYGIVSEGEFSKKNNLLGVPREAEEIDVSRQIIIARTHNLPIHIAHISTKGTVEMIRCAKKGGVKVTCETCPHYFSLTVEDTKGANPNAKMNPPLREKEDVEAIIEGLKDGTIDAIATDHAPHSEEEKTDISKCPNGIIGFETALKLGITYLVEPGYITLNKLIELMSFNPSKILKLNRGEIKVGEIADITIFNKDTESIYTKENIVSKSKNSPYIGFNLKGQVIYTIVNGNIIYSKGV